MPMYSYICPVCQAKSERASSMAASDKQRCDAGCDTFLAIDWLEQGKSGARIGDHEWHGKESKSLSLAFDPRKLGELRKDVPSLDLHPDGSVKFNSNSHQKRVYREMSAAATRIRQTEEHAHAGD